MRPFLLLMLGIYIQTAAMRAQPGMTISYHNLEAAYWNLLQPEGPVFFKSGFGAGFQYRLPLYEGGLIFMPGLNFAYFEKMTSQTGLNQAHLFQLRAALRIFPMDIFLHCDCPLYKRGLFAEGFAGWSRWDLVHKEADVQLGDVAFSPFFGLAAGFSIPYGKRIVVSPAFRYSYYPSVTWEGLAALRNSDTDPYFREETFLRQMSFEIQIHFGN